eukprot:jgi/Psemu1/286336/fgenesh1_pg.130_\
MDESEKNRGRTVFARRQQQQQGISFGSSVNSDPLHDSNHKGQQQRTKSKIGDFMIGVAAGFSSRNSLIAAGLGQAAASATVLPKHLDFSYRDRTDASAKRRFQVKVPCRLMAILALIFLVVPGLVFFHKEIHIHDDHYQYHFKQQNYINVDTKDVWDNFRLATNDEESQEAVETPDQEKAEIDIVEKDSAIGKSDAGISDSIVSEVENSDVVSSNNPDHDSTVKEIDIHALPVAGDGTSVEDSNEDELSHDRDSSVELDFGSSDKEHANSPPLTGATPTSSNLPTKAESSHTSKGDSGKDNKYINDSYSDNRDIIVKDSKNTEGNEDITKIEADPTAENNESTR